MTSQYLSLRLGNRHYITADPSLQRDVYIMTVLDIIRSRRSVRRWKEQPVEKKQMDALIEAIQKAPSAVNWQPYKFIFVDEAGKRKLVSQAAGQPNITKAPLLVVGVANPKRSPRWYLVDTVIALTQALLVAYDVGLAGVWLGAFDETMVKKALSIPEDQVIAGILALGVADEKPAQRPRKSIEDLFSTNDYSKPMKS
jgi:nitroreductase